MIKKVMKGFGAYVQGFFIALPTIRIHITVKLSDMYDRERFGLPSTISPLIRSQHRDSSGHHPSSSISGTGTSARLSGRERIDRDRDKDNTRRNENREPARRKGGESVDWRRG